MNAKYYLSLVATLIATACCDAARSGVRGLRRDVDADDSGAAASRHLLIEADPLEKKKMDDPAAQRKMAAPRVLTNCGQFSMNVSGRERCGDATHGGGACKSECCGVQRPYCNRVCWWDSCKRQCMIDRGCTW